MHPIPSTLRGPQVIDPEDSTYFNIIRPRFLKWKLCHILIILEGIQHILNPLMHLYAAINDVA